MTQDEYSEMWSKLLSERIELEEQVAALDNDLNEARGKLENVAKTLEYLRPLAGIPVGDDLSKLGMTDAIRVVLEKSKQRMSANDVRNALQGKGFDLSGYSNPMSSIYTVLGRLTAEERGAVIREQDDKRNVFYCWKNARDDDFAQSAEISDDDIPF
jgi:hypothetical protein